jgi:hypothetical protein
MTQGGLGINLYLYGYVIRLEKTHMKSVLGVLILPISIKKIKMWGS